MTPAEQRLAEGFLFTDMYQLTMSQLYHRMGVHETWAQFDHFFRNYPDYGTHRAGFCINAGLSWLLDWMQQARVTDAEIEVLRAQKGRTGERLFDDAFLSWLREEGGFDRLHIRAIPEGRVVHPHTPLTIVEGPLALAQILETSLLAQLNYQILIATKAARIRETCRAQLFLEFGIRRAHDRGANAGARAALIGGADFSSNVGISHVLGYPPKGTHAHSMVQVFLALGMSELDAFRAFAECYPDECILLVDTIDTLGSGIPNAVTVFEELRRKGHTPVAIRIDSGDLAHLAIQAAKMLDQAGFEDVAIVLSNNLDELVIWQILTQVGLEAPSYGVDPDKLVRRLVYGIGTRLITSAGEGALGGVYKLVAVHDKGEWRPAMKISNSPEKLLNPGNKKVWRVYDSRGSATADLLSLQDEDPQQAPRLKLRHPSEPSLRRSLRREQIAEIEPLQVEAWKDGKPILASDPIEQIRARRDKDLERLDSGVKRLVNPHFYHVSLSDKLWRMKQDLISSVSDNGAEENGSEG